MRKMIFAAALCAIIAAQCAAQETTDVRKDYAARDDGSKSAQGTVKEVSPASMARHSARIIITADSGEDVDFAIRPAGVVFDGSTGEILGIKGLAVGVRVLVNYAEENNGSRQAFSVKVLRANKQEFSEEKVRIKEPVRVEKKHEEIK